MIKVIKVHANAQTEVGAMQEEYQIDMEFAPALVDALMALVRSDRREYVGGMAVECGDYEYAGDELVWANVRIGDVWMDMARHGDGYLVHAAAWKQAEGDQRLDQLDFYRKCDGYLPGNFWIEPAAVLRALLKVAA